MLEKSQVGQKCKRSIIPNTFLKEKSCQGHGKQYIVNRSSNIPYLSLKQKEYNQSIKVNHKRAQSMAILRKPDLDQLIPKRKTKLRSQITKVQSQATFNSKKLIEAIKQKSTYQTFKDMRKKEFKSKSKSIHAQTILTNQQLIDKENQNESNHAKNKQNNQQLISNLYLQLEQKDQIISLLKRRLKKQEVINKQLHEGYKDKLNLLSQFSRKEGISKIKML